MSEQGSSIVVRKAKKGDWEKLWKLIYEMGKTDSKEEGYVRFNKILRDEHHYIPVACYQNHLVGYGWAQDYGFHLRTGKKIVRMNDLFVDSNYRKLGAGALLFNNVRAWADHRGASWLQWNSSPKVVDFYRRLGLEPIPNENDYPFFEVEFTETEKV